MKRILIAAAISILVSGSNISAQGRFATAEELKSASHGDMLWNADERLFVSRRAGEAIWLAPLERLTELRQVPISNLAGKFQLVKVEQPSYRQKLMDAVLRAIPLEPARNGATENEAKEKGPEGR